jgi:enediyne biosynthesis protein E4
LGLIAADFDGDGRQDLYVANDATPNQLWINLGEGKFEDQAMIRGCAVNTIGMPEAGMGITSADLDHNGWRDLFITHLVGEANRLYMNDEGYFSDTVLPRGPGAPSWPLTSFGVGFFDFDHDGHFDLYVSNGRVKRGVTDLDPARPYVEPDLLLRGVGGGEFEIVPHAGIVDPLLAAGRGAAFGDLDNDGDIDIVVVNRDSHLFILKNVAPKKGASITLRLFNRHGHMAVGADVRIDAGNRSWWRAVAPHESYGSSNDPRVHCGLGEVASVDQVLVRWPGGRVEVFGPFAVNQEHELREGNGSEVR